MPIHHLKGKRKGHRRTQTLYQDIAPFQYRFEIWPGIMNCLLSRIYSYNSFIIFWEGNNSFLCGGGLMVGCHSKQLRTSFVLIVITWAAFALFVAPFLHIDCVYLIALVIFTVNYRLLFATALTEVSNNLSIFASLDNLKISKCNYRV